MMFLQRPAKSLEDASRQADESEAELLRQWELASMRGEEVRSALPLPCWHQAILTVAFGTSVQLVVYRDPLG